ATRHRLITSPLDRSALARLRRKVAEWLISNDNSGKCSAFMQVQVQAVLGWVIRPETGYFTFRKQLDDPFLAPAKSRSSGGCVCVHGIDPETGGTRFPITKIRSRWTASPLDFGEGRSASIALLS